MFNLGYYINRFRKKRGVNDIIFDVFFFLTMIFPFAGLFLWYDDKFRFNSWGFVIFIFSLTPWIIFVLVEIRDYLIDLFFY